MGEKSFTSQPRGFLVPSRRWDGLTVGLYGGSFNPAHAGHLHVSKHAIKRLKLDALWWLVSPHNPLKQRSDLAPLSKRIKHAQSIAKKQKIYITSIEKEMGTHYSIDTILQLKRRYVRTRFIWILGADNLADFHRWRNWQEIFKMLPIAVLDRPGYSLRACSSVAARTFRSSRLPARKAPLLKRWTPPAWTFLPGPLHPASATDIRARQPHWAGAAKAV